MFVFNERISAKNSLHGEQWPEKDGGQMAGRRLIETVSVDYALC
jgi:hypothetical protein